MNNTAQLDGGAAIPLLGLGTWQLRGRTAEQIVARALDLGYRHIDTASLYGNEAEIGRALAASGVPRADVFVTTKLPPQRVGRERETLSASLDALQTDYVDLWLVHWPPRGAASRAAWRAFVAARERGLVRAIGVSNYNVSQIDDLTADSGATPSVNQVPWSPFQHDASVLEQHRARGVVLEGYSPFKRSQLSHAVLRETAGEHGVSAAQVVLRWHVQHGIVVIPKTATPARLVENFDIAGFELSADEMRRVDALST
ncbi:MAG: aldo/keto reductase [Candidatus Nanopelagicales bacterium]